MHARVCAAVVMVMVMSAPTRADPADPFAALRERVARVVGGAYDGAAFAQLTELSETIGPRVAGSKADAKSVEWAMTQLKLAGAKNVHTEPVKIARGWQRGAARARVVAPSARTLHVASVGWSSSTPAGGAKGAVIMTGSLATIPADVKGKIVVLDGRDDDVAGARAWLAATKLVAELKRGGAVALLLVSDSDNNVVGAQNFSMRGELTPLPVAQIGREDGAWISRRAAGGKVMMEIEITNTATGPTEIANVVGELPGSSSEWMLVGAHLDSWDFATGAQDNGSGVVQVIQTARLLAGAGPLARSVRFALWAGEEIGSVGSFAYIAAHDSELRNCVLAINTDNGAGHVAGWKVAGRKDLKTALAPISNGLLRSLGGAKLDMTLTADTDHFPFVIAGVPVIDLAVNMTAYWPVHHNPSDTIEKLDPHGLASGLAVVAVTALAVATSTQPLAPRLDHAAIEKLLEPDGYLEMIKVDGRWK